MSFRTRTLGVGLGLVALAALGMTVSTGAAQGGTLQVTVTYQGSGEVGPNNAVWVSAWDTPNIPSDGSVLPVGGGVVTENGGTVSLGPLSASTVYLTGLYDSQGGWMGRTVVPSGTPAGVYNPTSAGLPGAVTVGAGETVEIEFVFNDFYRMP